MTRRLALLDWPISVDLFRFNRLALTIGSVRL
jgi:hypothetical protein